MSAERLCLSETAIKYLREQRSNSGGRRLWRRPPPQPLSNGYARRLVYGAGVLRRSEKTLLGVALIFVPLGLSATQDRQPDPYHDGLIGLEKNVEIRASAEGEPALTAPTMLLSDAHHIYVLDPGAFGVHQFDERGRWLNTIGNRGEGPGEFEGPSDIGWLADTLWVADPSLNRLSLFDPHGLFLRTVRYGIVTGSEMVVPLRALSGNRTSSVPYVTARASGTIDSLPVLVLDADGEVQDTLAWRALGDFAASLSVRAEGAGNGGGAISISHPFDLRGFLAWDPRSRWLYVATWRWRAEESTELELVRVTALGDTTTSTRLPFERARASIQAVRSYAQKTHDGFPDALRSRVSARELTHALLSQIERPSETPVDRMMASEDGVLWFRRTNVDPATIPILWVAYRPDVGVLGIVELPLGHRLLATTGGLLWTVSSGELDLPTITGWRPRWSDR